MKSKETIETLMGAFRAELIEGVPENVLAKDSLLEIMSPHGGRLMDHVIIGLPDRDSIRLNKILDRIHTLQWVLDEEEVKTAP